LREGGRKKFDHLELLKCRYGGKYNISEKEKKSNMKVLEFEKERI